MIRARSPVAGGGTTAKGSAKACRRSRVPKGSIHISYNLSPRMRSKTIPKPFAYAAVFAFEIITRIAAEPSPAVATQQEDWNLHFQSTGIVQTDPAFHAEYSGPNSLNSSGETKHTFSFDLFGGIRLWRWAEAHVDGLVWQGFGLSNAVGIDGFPNGEAFRLGTKRPDAIIARAFVRQTIALGTETEKVESDGLDLAGTRPVSRLTITAGKLSVKDIFDNNAYANDPRTQFMNWGLMANEGWDYPADSLGYESGFAAELNQPAWALRCGLFQMPRISNGMSVDPHLTKAWGMVVEIERRYGLGEHPGVARVLFYDNRAHMGSYQVALDAASRPADVTAARAYRHKRGIGLNLEQEVGDGVGLFSRLGWGDGRNEAWAFSDVDHHISFGISVKGKHWARPDDTFGVAGVVNGVSGVHRAFLAAGGTGILAGDGALSYGTERVVETYYDAQLAKGLNLAIDYQFIANPAFNRARGPVSVFGARFHWEY